MRRLFEAACLLAVLAPLAGAYSVCSQITVQHSQVGGILTNYTMTIADTDPLLKSVANGGVVENASGFDIVFASDNQGANLLSWDQPPVWSPATGQIVTRVLVPAVSNTADTNIYRCAGNSAVNSFQGGPAGAAYDANTLGVWHFGSPTSLSVLDSGINSFNGTNHGATATAGPVYGAANFNGVSAYIDLGSASALNFISGNFTVEFWADPAAVQQQIPIGRGAYETDGWYINFLGSGIFGLCDEAPGNKGEVYSSQSYSSGSWRHYAFVRTGPTTASLYANGATPGSVTGSMINPATSSRNLWFGQYGGGGLYFAGALAEVVISGVARSAAWVLTDYNNQSNSAAFYTVTPLIPPVQISVSRPLFIQ